VSSIFFLIPIALLLLGVAVWAFVWAVRNDQFDDLDTPASRILFDDEPPLPDKEPTRPPAD
jgi:cbb3-type cytochrome oxidase maturation protein